VLPSVPGLPNRDRRLTTAGSLVLDFDVLAMLAVPLNKAERARVDAMIADDPQKGQRKLSGKEGREVRAARPAVR
jgi:hypothetical protein